MKFSLLKKFEYESELILANKNAKRLNCLNKSGLINKEGNLNRCKDEMKSH